MSFLFLCFITCSFVCCKDQVIRLLQVRGQRCDADVVVLVAHGAVAPSSAVIQSTAPSNGSTISAIPRGLSALIPALCAGVGFHDVSVVFVEEVFVEHVPSTGCYRTRDYCASRDLPNSLNHPTGPSSEEPLDPPGDCREKTSPM